MDIKSIAYTNIKVKSALESVATSLEGVTTAYDVWIAAGNQGTIQDFLDSLVPSFEINENGELEVTY